MKDFELKSIVDQVKERTDIVEVIDQRVELNHNKALCPFHDETKPSFTVNPDGQFFYCFGCDLGGDVITFLELYERRSFMDVLTELAERAGIRLDLSDPEYRKRIQDCRAIGDVLVEAARYYHQCLTPDVTDYLTRVRGFTEETITRFQIGYASGGLHRHLVDKKGMPVDLCIDAGVLKGEPDGTIKDYFYNRVVFPNMLRGRVIHMTARSLDGREPKYLHLPGEISHLFNEGDLNHEKVIITEGPTDCISAVQAGHKAVAVLGSYGFKPEYISKFSRCKDTYVCFDPDSAGNSGALKAAGMLGERAKIVSLPAGSDLNDYFRERDPKDFDELIDAAEDAITYQVKLIPGDVSKTELLRLLDPILKELSHMEKFQAEAHLRHTIKPHFDLVGEEVKGCRDIINRYRKEASREACAQHAAADCEAEYIAVFDGLIDLVEQDGRPAFLIKDDDGYSIRFQVEIDGTLYVPPPQKQIPWTLPRAEEVLKFISLQEEIGQQVSDQALYEDLRKYHRSISELPDERYYDLLVGWDFHTYCIESSRYSPVLSFYALPEKGKSRTGRGMIHVAYRGVHVESPRDAYLIRFANNMNVTFFFDMKSAWKRFEKEGSEDVLLQRFERGASVFRVLFPDRGPFKDTVAFQIFGATILGTNEPVDRILGTRSIQINMRQSSSEFEKPVGPEFSLPYKERLVAFRAAHYGDPLPDARKPAKGRLGDILQPIYQVIRLVHPEREPIFLELVREIEVGRQIEKSDSIEGEILSALRELTGQVEGGTLRVAEITRALNEGKPERSQVDVRRVGRRLSAMGFEKRRVGKGGVSAIVWNEVTFEQLCQEYGIEQTTETPETSGMWDPEDNSAGISEVSGVSLDPAPR